MILRSNLITFACAGFLLVGCNGDAARAQESGALSAPAATAATQAAASPYDKPGFVTAVVDGRLWVFRAGSQESQDFANGGRTPARHVVRPGVGPAGMTMRAPDNDDILLYLAAKDGFETVIRDERLWIFRLGSKEHDAFVATNRASFPARHVVRPGAGPLGTTLLSPEGETILEYLATKPGFAAYEQNGRIWVYPTDSQHYQEYLSKKSHPARHVVRPGAGPLGTTLRSPEAEYLDRWIVSQPGFVTGISDGRLWVFPVGSTEADDFAASGKTPARHVVRPGAGPMGMTIRSPEIEYIEAYRRVAGLH